MNYSYAVSSHELAMFHISAQHLCKSWMLEKILPGYYKVPQTLSKGYTFLLILVASWSH